MWVTEKLLSTSIFSYSYLVPKNFCFTRKLKIVLVVDTEQHFCMQIAVTLFGTQTSLKQLGKKEHVRRILDHNFDSLTVIPKISVEIALLFNNLCFLDIYLKVYYVINIIKLLDL